MKIEWNRVTWYSKALALAVFLIVSIAGFFWGIQVGYLEGYAGGIAESSSYATTVAQSQSGSGYYADVSAWQTDQSDNGGFSFAYPLDFPVQDNYGMTASENWRLGSNGAPGNLFATLTIPPAFEPQTNFVGATLTIGSSRNDAAIAQCLTPDQSGGPAEATTTMTVNNATFTVFHSSDAGAGNYYDTTSYRTLHDGQCYAVEYTIHSSQIMNYPASYGLMPFDQKKASDVLDAIVGTFKFL